MYTARSPIPYVVHIKRYCSLQRYYIIISFVAAAAASSVPLKYSLKNIINIIIAYDMIPELG